jgi:multiple sugar transport system substrate-binding protein
VLGAGVLLGTTGVLAACGQQQATDTRPSLSAAQGSLRWTNWATGASLERTVQKQKVFADLYPRVTVEAVSIPNSYAEKIVAETVGGTAADVIQVDAYYAIEWAANGIGVPLDDRMAKTKDARKADFQEVFLGDMTHNGKVFGLPTDVGPCVVAYNPDLFTRAGVPQPYDLWKKDAWTIEAFVDAGKKIVGLDPGTESYLFDGATSFQWWLPVLWGAGGELYDEKAGKFVANTPAAVEALQWNRDFMHALRLAPTPQRNAGAQGITFKDKRVASQMAWPKQPSRYSDEIGREAGIVPLPRGKKGSVAVSKANSFYVWSGGKQQDLAFELARAMTSLRGEVEEMRAYGFIYPARKDSVNDKEFQSLARWDLGVHKYATERGHRLPLLAELPWAKMSKAWDDATRPLWRDEVSAKQAAEQMTTQLNNELSLARGKK